MAFASVGTVGSVQSKAADQASLALTTNATIEAGNLGVLIIALDNDATESGTEVTGVVDSAGNTWTRAIEFSFPRNAQAGCTVSCWYCKLGTQLSSGGTITASFSNSTNRDATAATAWEFTMAANKVPALEGTPNTGAGTGNWFTGSFDVTTANIECLRVFGGANEGNNANNMSPNTNWTVFTHDTTTGGGAASNMGVYGQWRILTGTNENIDPPEPTGGVGDTSCVYFALKETDAPSGPSNAVKTGMFAVL